MIMVVVKPNTALPSAASRAVNAAPAEALKEKGRAEVSMRWWLLGFWLMTVPAWAGMGPDEARHLLLRSGFAPTLHEVESFATLDRAAAVERLLGNARTGARTPVPAGVTEPIDPQRRQALRNNTATEAERKQFLREQIEKGLELRAWWLREMIETDSPLTERLTLFWHNHFVSSQQKVKSSALMVQQNQTLRRHALGNFGKLLHAIARDPAMVIYLDNVSNKKGSPNENFAREVMELFTLGEGHYSERDIKEAARAFTGWSLDRSTGEFRFYRALHDSGEKSVLGRSGRFNGDAVLDILLAQPATAEFITAKLWREFVSPQPDAAEVKRIAAEFRNSGYDIPTVLRALLTSKHFYAPENRATLIKSPVELVVGSFRQFGIQPQDLRAAALITRQLGQDLFAPPNVKGWPGGEAWINSSMLLARRQLLARLTRGEEMPLETMGRERPMAQRLMQAGAKDYGVDLKRWSGEFNGAPAARHAQMQRLLLAAGPNETLDMMLDDQAFVSTLLLDPVYQLK
jgi:uncharacterized protein (DUF1800 family)